MDKLFRRARTILTHVGLPVSVPHHRRNRGGKQGTSGSGVNAGAEEVRHSMQRGIIIRYRKATQRLGIFGCAYCT